MTMPGAPMIYYGDEVGMWGGDDPDCRKPMVWQNLKYDPETTDPLGRPRSIDSIKFNYKMFDWYKKLISIRNENKALSLGDLNFFLINNDKKIIGYSRSLDSTTIFVLVNNKNKNEELTLDLNKFENHIKNLINLLNEHSMKGENNNYKVELGPYGIAILK